MDVSSEMIHALLPVYLVVGLGTSVLAVGIIEGIAEATARDHQGLLRRAQRLAGQAQAAGGLGYGLAACTKPVFPLAPSVGWLIAARFVDRVGKGIRGAPRDALVADLSPAHLRGASFGLRQSLDTVGAFLGPLLAIGLMWLTADDFTAVFWIAVVPAFLSLALILFAVREPGRADGLRRRQHAAPPSRAGPARRRLLVGRGRRGVFTLARFSEAFLILRAQSVGLPLMLVPAVLVVMNIAYAASAFPVGISRTGSTASAARRSASSLLAADLVLAWRPATPWPWAACLWGLHMGFTQGLLATLVADSAPAELRGTAFGMFNLVTGLALLAASLIAGALWQLAGPQATFLAGAAFTTLTLLGALPLRRRLGSRFARR